MLNIKKVLLFFKVLFLILLLVGCVNVVDTESQSDPIGISFVVETSEEMEIGIFRVRRGLKSFLERSHMFEDKFALIEFERDSETLFRFDNIDSSLMEEIENLDTNRSGVAFWDGIHEGLEAIVDADEANMTKGVVVFAAGEESGRSDNSRTAVKELAQENNIPIHTFAFGDINENILKDIAEETDGTFRSIHDSEDAEDMFLDLLRDLRLYDRDVNDPYM